VESIVRFTDAVRVCLRRKYADFSGRAGRAEYWWFVLFIVLATIALYAIAVVAVLSQVRLLEVAAELSIVVLWLGLLVPGVAVAVRRLHDLNTGMPGWYALLVLVPFGGFALLFMFMMEGGPDNKYGPPLEGSAYPRVGPAGGAVPAGWLTDPEDASRLRYWTGIAWTEHTHRP
jgi:uncharacterized membrane protein YhaH (DUF805 family)